MPGADDRDKCRTDQLAAEILTRLRSVGARDIIRHGAIERKKAQALTTIALHIMACLHLAEERPD
jgi:hypothetical protein